MFCVYCGTKGGGGNFCTECGMNLTTSCICCGSVIIYSKDFNYCYECGTRTLPLRNAKVKKPTRKDILYKSYPVELAKITEFLNQQKDWVSYQQIAEYLGVQSCYSKINPLDDKSTIGQLIYIGDIRSLGFEVQPHSFKARNITNGDVKNYVIRFIKPSMIGGRELGKDEIISEAKRAYHNYDFTMLEIIS